MHIILQLCYKILRSCEKIATIRTTVRFFLSKSLRNSLKYFFNHIIFYSFSFEFLLIIINFLLNKFSLIKTSSKTPFLINTASNLLHNSMPPLHRKRSHLLKERLSTHNAFRIAPLEGSCQRGWLRGGSLISFISHPSVWGDQWSPLHCSQHLRNAYFPT